MIFSILTLLMIFCFDVFSFDGSKCKQKIYEPITKRIAAGPTTWLLSSSIAPISSTQFISSTGSCSAIANSEIQKKQFIANNYEPLKIDMARGGGEFIFAYANLAGCKKNHRNEYSHVLQKKFIEIYGQNLNNKVEDIFGSIEKTIEQNQILKRECFSNTI